MVCVAFRVLIITFLCLVQCLFDGNCASMKLQKVKHKLHEYMNMVINNYIYLHRERYIDIDINR